MSMLAALGLTEAEENLYDHLVSHPGDLTQLREATGHGPGRLSRLLAGLRSRGMVRVEGRPPRYSAVPPEVALGPLLLARERELVLARTATAQLMERFRDTIRTGDPRDLVEIISGRSDVAHRYRQLQESARSLVRLLDRPPYLTDPLAGNPVELQLLRAGVGYRTIYDAEAIQIPDRAERIKAWIVAGEGARLARALPMKLLIVDERVALMPLHASGVGELDAAIVVHPSALLDALTSLFETLWNQAATWEPGVEGNADRWQRQLLVMLNAGLTEDAIARHLNVSRSTVDRRLRELATILGVRTRFQAGVEAAARGLVPTGPAGAARSRPGQGRAGPGGTTPAGTGGGTALEGTGGGATSAGTAGGTAHGAVEGPR